MTGRTTRHDSGLTVNHPHPETTIYTLRKQFRYAYPSPIRNLRQRMIIVPPATHGGQKTLSFDLRTSENFPILNHIHSQGNHVATFNAHSLSKGFSVEMSASVLKDNRTTTLFAGDMGQYLKTSRLTTSSPEIQATAAMLFVEAASPREIALIVRDYVYRHMKYAFGATSVSTTASEAYTIGAGLCQDYAHIMISICRAAGIPARYVSGHLAGEQGGSHAWVETLYLEEGRVIAEGHDPHERLFGRITTHLHRGRPRLRRGRASNRNI